MLRVITSTSAAVRLAAAVQFLETCSASTEVVVVAATRGAADDFVRSVARRAAATFGLTRFGLTELAARASASRLAAVRRAPATQVGAEAVAARAAFGAVTAGELEYFSPVAGMPGFPKASPARFTNCGSPVSGLTVSPLRARDAMSAPWRVSRPSLDRVGVEDRAAMFRLAADAVREGRVRWAGADRPPGRVAGLGV